MCVCLFPRLLAWLVSLLFCFRLKIMKHLIKTLSNPITRSSQKTREKSSQENGIISHWLYYIKTPLPIHWSDPNFFDQNLTYEKRGLFATPFRLKSYVKKPEHITWVLHCREVDPLNITKFVYPSIISNLSHCAVLYFCSIPTTFACRGCPGRICFLWRIASHVGNL